MKPDLEIDLLRSFAAVAETRNFTRAAERLNRAQSAVSMQIKRLERIVATKVFERTRRSVKLTSGGEALLRYAHRMLQLTEEALLSFGQRTVHGRVRLGVTDTSMCYLPPVLTRFAESYPLVELEIRCDRSWQALDALEAGEADLVLVTQPCGRTGGTMVRREPLVWAAARTSAADQLDPVPLALFAPGCIYRDAALKALKQCGRRWRHAYNSPSREGLDVAVAAGLAVTIVPKSVMDKDLRPLGTKQGFPKLPQIELLLYRASHTRSGPMPALAAAITETLGARRLS